MNSSNVDFYIAGFGANGKRVGSIICDFNPEKNPKKLKEALAEAKEKFPDVVVVEPIGADAFNQYLEGYIRGTDGKPVEHIAPDPTAEEKKAAKQAVLQSAYEVNKEEIMKYYLAAIVNGDTDTQAELKQELADLDAQFDADIKALDA